MIEKCIEDGRTDIYSKILDEGVSAIYTIPTNVLSEQFSRSSDERTRRMASPGELGRHVKGSCPVYCHLYRSLYLDPQVLRGDLDWMNRGD